MSLFLMKVEAEEESLCEVNSSEENIKELKKMIEKYKPTGIKSFSMELKIIMKDETPIS